ncbi:hypothetical protein V8D89_009443 [Ganoderma adspersum]
MRASWRIHSVWAESGRVGIATGRNMGLGYETTKEMLKHNAKIYLAARNQEKANAAIAALKEETGHEVIFLQLDQVASLASVKAAAQDGMIWPPVDMLTADSYDLQFGTNILGHFYFTELFVRVLTLALLDGVKASSDGRSRSCTSNYYQSKLANCVVARQVAKCYGDQGILFISVNPGNIQTDLDHHIPRIAWTIILLKPVQYGALTQLFAGTMPEVVSYNGKFLILWVRLRKPYPAVLTEEVRERMWDWLSGEVHVFEAHQ